MGLLHYAVTTGKPVTAAEQAAPITQSRSKLLADPRFRTIGDEGRQKVYESALIPALLAKANTDRDLARRNLSTLLGEEPEQVRLTTQGVTPLVHDYLSWTKLHIRQPNLLLNR